MKLKRGLAKKLTSAALAALMTMAPVTSFAVEGGLGTLNYREITEYGNGFTYTKGSYSNSTYGAETAFQLTTQPGTQIKPIVVSGDIYGGMNIQKAVEVARNKGYNVLGAVNSDFFTFSTGIPLGINVENGVYKSNPDGYPAVAFDYNGNATIVDSANVYITLTNNGVESNGNTVTFTHFNKQRVNGNGICLYDSNFGSDTKTSSSGWFVKMRILSGSMTVSGNMTLEVYDVYQGTGAVALNEGEMVLTADDTSNLQWQFEQFHVGDQISLTTTCDSPAIVNAAWATGGGTVLVRDGSVTDSSTWDKSVGGSQPRTAVGIKPDGTVVYLVVDGRQSGYSAGVSYWQIITELKSMGCTNVINFDGGGSTAMALRLPGDSSTTLVSSPSGKAMRSCATYVVFVAETVADGNPQHLYLSNRDAYVYANSGINLQYTATDSGYYPVAVPSDLTPTVTAGGGELEGSYYRAPDATGDVVIGLSSPSTGASGSGRLHVVQNASLVTMYVNGSAAKSSMQVEPGDTFQITASASYGGNYLHADADLFRYSVSEGFGTITSDGKLTINEDAVGTGYLTVSLGGTSKTISLSTATVFSDIVGNWAEAYITSLYEKGIVTGSEGKYYPSSNIKRGDFVLMLYRAAGSPKAPSDDGFADVGASDYYASAIGWAAENNIAKGDGTNFAPLASLTREDAFTFIYRYLSNQNKLTDSVDMDTFSGFSDSSAVSDYAVTPTATLMTMGLVNGSEGMIHPQNNLTRAEMAKILCKTIG